MSASFYDKLKKVYSFHFDLEIMKSAARHLSIRS